MESRDRETMAGKWRSLSYPLILLLLGALRFVNLGFVDMQAWDEGLYAVRAISILKFGGWIDQSAHAIGGLYSALHPPLYIWLEALSLKIFGITEFAVRFPSALLAAGTLLIIFAIGKNLADRETGFIAALLYGINPFVDFYARQGQFDSALVFFLTLAVYLIIIAEKKSSNRFAFFSGLAVGCALMTKLFVGFGIPLAYGIWWAFRKDRISGGHAKKMLLMLV
ncbi:MAG: glycosyltransferase family 39 protein, partial [Bacteroidota bacterium]